MARKSILYIIGFIVIFISSENNSHAGSQPFLTDNISYEIKIGEKLSKEIIKELSYKIIPSGNYMEPNFNENAPYTLVKFHNGEYEPQGAKIQKIAHKTSKDSSISTFSFYMQVSNGVNSVFSYIVIATPVDSNTLHINQALMDYPNIGLNNIKFKNNKVIIDSLLHKGSDPNCCPTNKVPLTFIINNDKIECSIKNITF